MKKLFDVVSHYQRIKRFYLRYERLLMPATLVIGFLVDYLTFTSIQITTTFALLLIYWLIAGATIAFINLYNPDTLPQKLKYLWLFSPLIIQFTFGALLGSSLIFYWLSSAFSVSWPIILVVALLMVFNEIFRHYFLKPIVQISVYFFTTFSLFSLILPYLFNSFSPWLFVLAGTLSSILFYSYITILARAKNHIQQQKKQFLVSIFAILLVMNFFYFSNIIPPIPLSLREAGLYHDLNISGGLYHLQGEAESIWEKIIPGQILHLKAGQKMYAYTAIFAPNRLQTKILHDWQYYDPEKKEWISRHILSFTISGGRKAGYKGYSFASDVLPGKWRIYVKNERGQVLGKIQFKVEKVEQEVKLQETVR